MTEISLCTADYALEQLPELFQNLSRKQVRVFISQVVQCGLLTYEHLRAPNYPVPCSDN